MKKIKIINLLNKIANGEEVPKKIKYNMYDEGYNIFTYCEEDKEYVNDYDFLSVRNHHLNDKVEIIEDAQHGENNKIKKVTLLGEVVGLGSMIGWLENSTENETKLCSAIEAIGIKLNEIIDKVNEEE